MPAMRAPADLVESAPGRYEGTMNLSMRGEWPLTLTFESPAGQPVRLQFDLATDRADMPIAAGGAPIDGASQPAASADAGGMPRYRAGDLVIAADIEPRTARVGENRLILEVRDEDVSALEDALGAAVCRVIGRFDDRGRFACNGCDASVDELRDLWSGTINW